MGTFTLPHPPEGDAGGGAGGAGTGGTRGTRDDDESRPDRVARLYARLRDLLWRSTWNVVPYARVHDAERRASERREALEHWDAEYAPFVELPPGQEHAEIPFGKTDGGTTRLLDEWQARASELLLLARAGDAVLWLLAREAPDPRGFAAGVDRTQPVVVVKPVSRLLRAFRPQLFRWRVEVRTTDPQFFRKGLADVADWLGIGVDVVRGQEVEQLGRCREPGGRDGTIGGVLVDVAGDELELTCAHVVSPRCCAAAWRATLPQAGCVSDDPDAALLRSDNTCFATDGGFQTPLGYATQEQLTGMMASGSVVTRVGAGGGAGQGHVSGFTDRGAVESPAGYVYPIAKGVLSRFPVVTLGPRRRRWRINRRFSTEGDSGSWVVDRDAGLWIGMVVSGQGGLTYAQNAERLVAHIRQHTQADVERAYTCST